MKSAAPVLPQDDLPFGHNNPPPDFAITRKDVDERVVLFLKGLDIWATRPALDADTAPRALDFQKGLKLLKKEADESRATEKKPHDDAAKEVQSYWKGLEARLDKALDVITPKLGAWQKKLDDDKRAAEAAAREIRLAAEREAEAQRQAAAHATSESARIEAEARAEEAAKVVKAAAKTEKAAARPAQIESSTGLANRAGTRKVAKVVITDLTRALLHFKRTNQTEFEELVTRLAAAAFRGSPVVDGVKQQPDIPGVSFNIEEVFS